MMIRKYQNVCELSTMQQETTDLGCIKIKLESLLPWDEATLRNREGSPKPFRAVITYSPAVQRKTMHIPRTLLDLETTTSGGEGTGDEGPRHQKKPSSSHHLLQLSSPTLARTTRQVQLPPELIVIPAQQGSDGQQYFERNADLKGSTRGPASKDASPNKEFRRDYSRSPARTLGEVSDSESGRLRSSKISLKQSIWTIVPPPDHRAKAPLSRSASMSDSCELVLLKSCSEKLLELKKVDKEAFAGRRRWHRAEGTQCPPPVQRNKKVKRKAPKLKKREVQEERPNLSLKIRGLRPDDSEQQYETNWLSTGKRSTSGATRKFRKGGIVATAVQMRPLSGYTSGADESAIVSGAAATATVGKKKRKKRKLQAIQKQVKSVISFVTASASHRPNKSDQQETAKKKNK